MRSPPAPDLTKIFPLQNRRDSLSAMPDQQKQGGNSQTLCVDLQDLVYEVVEQSQGNATAIRFQLLNETIKIGDVLVVLDGVEIKFHGMIGAIDETGRATAVDRRGSSISATLH